jgi:hypothetical protein
MPLIRTVWCMNAARRRSLALLGFSLMIKVHAGRSFLGINPGPVFQCSMRRAGRYESSQMASRTVRWTTWMALPVVEMFVVESTACSALNRRASTLGSTLSQVN